MFQPKLSPSDDVSVVQMKKPHDLQGLVLSPMPDTRHTHLQRRRLKIATAIQPPIDSSLPCRSMFLPFVLMLGYNPPSSTKTSFTESSAAFVPDTFDGGEDARTYAKNAYRNGVFMPPHPALSPVMWGETPRRARRELLP